MQSNSQHCVIIRPTTDKFMIWSFWGDEFETFLHFMLWKEHIIPCILTRFFGRFIGVKIDSWNWVGTKCWIDSAMSHRMLICKEEIHFSFPVDSCHSVCVLEMCWSKGVSFPHTQHTVWRRQFFNFFTWNQCLQESIPQQNWFLTRNRFHLFSKP